MARKRNPNREYTISEYDFSVSHKTLEKYAGGSLTEEQAELIASYISKGLHALVADHIGELILDGINDAGFGDGDD